MHEPAQMVYLPLLRCTLLAVHLHRVMHLCLASIAVMGNKPWGKAGEGVSQGFKI